MNCTTYLASGIGTAVQIGRSCIVIVSVAPRSGSEQETLPRLIFLVYCPICNIHTLRIYDP